MIVTIYIHGGDDPLLDKFSLEHVTGHIKRRLQSGKTMLVCDDLINAEHWPMLGDKPGPMLGMYRNTEHTPAPWTFIYPTFKLDAQGKLRPYLGPAPQPDPLEYTDAHRAAEQ